MAQIQGGTIADPRLKYGGSKPISEFNSDTTYELYLNLT